LIEEGIGDGLQAAEPAFGPGGEIPFKYTGDGAELSPPLRWTDPPEGTKSFALAVDDRDDLTGIWVLWLLYGMAATARELLEGVPREDTVAGVGRKGLNDFGEVGYLGPRPPPGPAHLYVFRLHALDITLALPPRRRKADLLKAVAGHILVRVDLIARYQRT
jgi:Raf kinase inhibitor-like YbhB/YbcL family protein